MDRGREGFASLDLHARRLCWIDARPGYSMRGDGWPDEAEWKETILASKLEGDKDGDKTNASSFQPLWEGEKQRRNVLHFNQQ